MSKLQCIAATVTGLVFSVHAAVLVDNPAAHVLSGNWNAGTGVSGFRGADYLYASGSGSAVKWVPDVEVPNYYKVYVHYTSHTNRTTNAVYSVSHMDGEKEVVVDQTGGGGAWRYIGRFPFDVDNSGSITLSGGADGKPTVADAVRLLIAPNNYECFLDNTDAVKTGNWKTSSSLSGYEGSDYAWIAAGSSGTAVYELDVPANGVYALYATYTAYDNRAEQVAYEIVHDEGIATAYVDQTVEAPSWGARRYHYLGSYLLSDSSAVTIRQNTAGIVCADAVIARWYEGGPPPGDRWEMIFNDEFEDAELDTTIWEAVDAQVFSSEKYCSTRWKENVTVTNGALSLLTKKENRSGEVDPAMYHSWQEYTTGSVKTTEPVAKYGYFEARLKYAGINGQNNAFWSTADETDHPGTDLKRQDITIEGGTQDLLRNQRIHFARQYVESNGYENKDGFSYFTYEDLGAEYHLYGFEWNEEWIHWYFDGLYVTSFTNENCHYSNRVLLSTMLLNDPGLATNNFPLLDGDRMEVDWVRVFQLTD